MSGSALGSRGSSQLDQPWLLTVAQTELRAWVQYGRGRKGSMRILQVGQGRERKWGFLKSFDDDYGLMLLSPILPLF